MALRQIYYAAPPVPTASGVAHALGWLAEEFAPDGIDVGLLDRTDKHWWHQYAHHGLTNLVREGGNIHALAARSRGAPTKLIGLTWIDEHQVILVGPNTGPIAPEQLKGMRVALPAQADHHGDSAVRGMTLHGFKGALGLAGLTLDDVQFVEVPLDARRVDAESRVDRLWTGVDYLVAGKVDAVYVKGASAIDTATRAGVMVGVNLDAYPSRLTRVNNGTPRPITVHEEFLADHFDLVVRFLRTTLRAADWAADNLPDLSRILQKQTQSSQAAVAIAYRNGFHRSLHPTLDRERLHFLEVQAQFLLVHGLLPQAVDLEDWIDARPLQVVLGEAGAD